MRDLSLNHPIVDWFFYLSRLPSRLEPLPSPIWEKFCFDLLSDGEVFFCALPRDSLENLWPSFVDRGLTQYSRSIVGPSFLISFFSFVFLVICISNRPTCRIRSRPLLGDNLTAFFFVRPGPAATSISGSKCVWLLLVFYLSTRWTSSPLFFPCEEAASFETLRPPEERSSFCAGPPPLSKKMGILSSRLRIGTVLQPTAPHPLRVDVRILAHQDRRTHSSRSPSKLRKFHWFSTVTKIRSRSYSALAFSPLLFSDALTVSQWSYLRLPRPCLWATLMSPALSRKHSGLRRQHSYEQAVSTPPWTQP